MKCSGVDRDLAPGRDLNHSCLTSLVSDDESSVLGAGFGNYRRLGSPQQSLTETPKSMWRQLTGGNILNVSYSVLCGWEIIHRNERSDKVLGTHAVTRFNLGISS